MRLALADSLRSDQLEPLDPVPSPIFSELFEFRNFGFVSGHHDFPAIAVRDAVRRAKLLGQPIPFHAKARFEKFRRIVDA